MANYVELTPEDLHTATSQEVQDIAAAEDRIPGGNYYGRVTKVTLKRINDDAEFNAGRSLATLTTSIVALNDPTAVLGTQFIDVSWEPRFRADGQLDATARRWVELVKALGARTEDVNSVLNLTTQQLFCVKIRETFRVDDGDLLPVHAKAKVGNDGTAWVNVPVDATGDKVYEHYYDLGYESRTMIDRIFKAK